MAINKDVNYKLKAEDDLSPKILNLNKNLSDTEAAMKKVEQESLLTAKSMEKIASSTQIANENTANLNKGLNSINSDSVTKTAKALEILSKAAQLSASSFLLLAGQDRALELINNAAIKLSVIVDNLADKMKSMGGVFSKAAIALEFLGVGLRNGVAGMGLLAVAGQDATAANETWKNSVLSGLSAQMTFLEKVKVGSELMQTYGSALLQADGAMNKLKGTFLVAAGTVGEYGAKATSFFGSAITNMGMFVAAATAIIGIDKLFVPLNNAIFAVGEGALKMSWKADEAYSSMAKGTGILSKVEEGFYRFGAKGLEGAATGLSKFQGYLQSARAVLDQFTGPMKLGASLLANMTEIFGAAAKHTEIFQKGLAGLTARAGAFGSAFTSVGMALLQSDGIIGKLSGVTLVALGIALGGLVTIIYKVLDAVGGLIYSLGSQLTEASMKQIEVFAEFQSKTFAFEHTIKAFSKSTDEAAKSIDVWGKYVKESSSKTGQTTATMQALVAETLSATEAFAFSEEQMKKLIDRTIDLSERAHKPAIDTLTAMIQGINGNGQALIPLGIHLSDSSVAHSKLSKEQKELYKTTDDLGKANIRYAVLMEQAGKATNFASDNSDLYSKSIKLQENAIQSLNAELGKGAEIINGEVVWGYATATQALTNFTRPILPMIGFLQALGGRLLEVVGIISKNLLAIALLTSSYKGLQTLMSKGFETGFFDKTIPFANKSLNQLATSLSGTEIKLKTLGDAGKASLAILGNQALGALKGILGLEEGAKITAAVVASRLATGFTAAGAAILSFGKSLGLLLINPITLYVVAAATAAYVLYKAFQKLEEETAIFSKVWGDLVKWWEETSPAMDLVKKAFSGAGEVLMVTFGAVVKLTAAALAGLLRTVYSVIGGFQELASFLPDSIAPSSEAIMKMRERINLLDNAMISLTGGAINDMANVFMGVGHAAEISAGKILSWEQQLALAEKQIGSFTEAYKKIAETVTAYTPTLNIANIEVEAKKATEVVSKMLDALKAKQNALISGSKTPQVGGPDNSKEISDNAIKIKQAEEVLKGVKLKAADDVRKERINIATMEMNELKQKVYSTEQEITSIKINADKERRDLLVSLETQRLLAQRNLISADAKAGMTVKQQAAIEANNTELTAYKARLDAEVQLATTAEQQKQLALAQMKASMLSGTGGPGETAANQNVEVLQEQQKINQLMALKQQDLANAQWYEDAKLAIQQAAFEKSLAIIVNNSKLRADALGNSPEAYQAKIALEEQQNLQEQERLKTLYANKILTDQEFNAALEEAEYNTAERKKQIQEDQYKAEIDRDRKRGDIFKGTLKEIEMAQQQHGIFMGTLQATANSRELNAVSQMASNLSAFRNSKNRSEFEIGKKAAIAGALISTYQAAAAALAPPPLGVGPLLGPALAATAVIAGMFNVRQIQAQKFDGGSSSAATGAAAPIASIPTQTIGGQAHDGMDAIPKSMNNKSFILSGGERIVQPEANKQLTSFLDRAESSGFGGNSINITINGNVDSKDRVNELANAIILRIREKSERGETVISKRGIA